MQPIVHFELHSADLTKTLPFFEKLFGWKLQKFEEGRTNTGWRRLRSRGSRESAAGS